MNDRLKYKNPRVYIKYNTLRFCMYNSVINTD